MSAAAGTSISVIVPAYDREHTIGRTLDSLLAQTFEGWEALVVDDGSGDDTGTVVEGYVARDPRIRLLRQANAGVSAARNRAIEEAAGEWLFFLDADDWIEPGGFEALLAGAAADPEADAILGACQRIDENGRKLWIQRPEQERDLFTLFARTCGIVIHSCLTKTEMVRRAGGFDPALATCEDWDLWQRIARLGAKFKAVPETVSVYWMRAGSASRAGNRMLDDGLVVIDRGHGTDTRLPDVSAPVVVTGGEGREVARTYFLCYTAGVAAAAGEDPLPMIERLGEGISRNVDPEGVAETVFNSVADGLGRQIQDWPTFDPEIEVTCRRFLGALGKRLGGRWHARGALGAFERLVLAQDRGRRSGRSGRWYLTEVDLEGPAVADLEVESGVEKVLCRVSSAGRPLGEVELPALAERVPARVIADSIAAGPTWDLMQALFERHRHARLEVDYRRGGVHVRDEHGQTLYDGPLDPVRTPRQGLHDKIGWTLFLRDLWAAPRTPGLAFYDEPGERDAEPGEPLRVEPGQPVTIEVSRPLPRLLADATVSAQVTVAGVPLTTVDCRPRRGAVTPHQLRRAILLRSGFELCRSVIREGVLLMPPADGEFSLRVNLQRARAARDGEGPLGDDPGRLAVVGRSPGADGTSVSRWMALPVAAAPSRLELARAEDTPVTGDGERATSFFSAPLVLARAETAGVADDVLIRSVDGVAAGRRRGLGRLFELGVRRGARTPGGDAGTGKRLPILMYHRVAPSGGAATRRWRLHPEAFEQQLAYLRDNGYQALSFEQWRAVSDRRHPIPRRSVMLTFDDGYADFIDHALPLLTRYGFPATMFIVTDLVGASNVWDDDLGERIELMDWDAVEAIRDAGIGIGSHSARHHPLTALAPSELAADLSRSRVALQERLGETIESICYPFGLHDASVAYISAACGYSYGVTTNEWHASFGDDLMRLPRIEITGTESIAEFAGKLER